MPLQIIYGDITKIKIDAFVNATNKTFIIAICLISVVIICAFLFIKRILKKASKNRRAACMREDDNFVVLQEKMIVNYNYDT